MLTKRYQPDPAFTMKPRFMSDAALSEMYSARPVTTSDVIFFQRKSRSVFLTTRKIRPAEGLWVVGGARLAGETATQAIRRKTKVETGLDIDEDRFLFLGIVEFIWPYRIEQPSDEGRHDINYVFGLEATDEELTRAAKNLDPEEYDVAAGLAAFNSVEELRRAGVQQNIIDYYCEIFDNHIGKLH